MALTGRIFPRFLPPGFPPTIVHAVLILVLRTGAAAAQEGPALRGIIRDRDGGEPVARVLVEAVGRSRQAWSDSLGTYELPLLAAGPQRIRLSRLGYAGLDLEVELPSSGVMRLDVTLSPRPLELSGVRLESLRDPREPPGAGPGEASRPEIGAWSFTPGDGRLGAPLGEPDALWATSGAPDVVLRPDLPTSLHVRGGSADQNLVLLDGIPVLSPYHAGGVLSALPVDAVEEVRLHGGVAPASLGGALSSAIEIRTVDVPRHGLASAGGIAIRGMRGAFGHALPGGRGGLLLAGRRSYRPGFPGGDDKAGRFGDLVAKLTLDLPRGAIDVLGFTSEDRLAFAAAPEPDGDATAGGESAIESDPAPVESSNRFGWGSRALGITWRGALAGGARGEVRAWGSGFDATLDWASDPGGLRLRSSRSQVGGLARIDGPLAGGSASAGVSLEGLRVRYDLRDLATPDLAPPDDSLLGLESRAAILSAFLEQEWSAGERWSFRTGLRGQTGPVRDLLVEPRLSLSFAPSADVLLSAGYARTHQAVQSLRNEESILDAVAGIDLPVMAGMPGVPVGRSDQLAASVGARLGTATRFELEAYTRWLDGLVLVAPTTSQPFAVTGFETGRGRASGAALVLDHQGPRLAARASYAVGSVVRRTDGVEYHTTYERPRSLSAAVDWRVFGRTRVASGLTAAIGSSTTALAGPLTWEPFNPLVAGGELEGSPQRTTGPLNGQRLPTYLRLDLGVRQEWGVGWLREGAVLAAHLDVLNLLDRQNVVGYALDPDTGARRPLTLLGRSLTFGLEWRY
jgi:hypothetical protein